MIEEIEGKWKRVRSCVKYGDVMVVFTEEANHTCAKALGSTHKHMHAAMHVTPICIDFACMRQG